MRGLVFFSFGCAATPDEGSSKGEAAAGEESVREALEDVYV